MQYLPQVNQSQEFKEIAFDFSNSLELVREAISNAFDVRATHIKIGFSMVMDDDGEERVRIYIYDNGSGMDIAGIHSFFDLGNSLSRGDDTKIGEKGHGTKVYINSNRIIVKTQRNNKKYLAIMDEPRRKLNQHQIPTVDITETQCDDKTWSCIEIYGYNNNRVEKFTHENLKDYILWFTKMGSIERIFGFDGNRQVKLELKGIDESQYETIDFGHVFPKESMFVDKLFDEYLVNAPKYFCKSWKFEGTLKNYPYIQYQAIFFIEGNNVKYDYNKMIRHSGYTAPQGSYTIQERYGLWLCKDFIPVQRMNEWITTKGQEYTKFHAFFNCQKFRLTANRGSIENTPSEIMQDIEEVVKNIYKTIVESDYWTNIDWLGDEVEAYKTSAKEIKDFERRLNQIKKTKIATYKNLHLVEPTQENGVFSIYMMLSSLEPSLFPFQIVDYDTHSGIDVIVKPNDTAPTISSQLYYVEFKNYLDKDKQFNHSFDNLKAIVCWDINTKTTRHGTDIVDLANEHRTLQIIPPENVNDYTHYYLDNSRKRTKIEVYVLKAYLEEKLNIRFKARNCDDMF